METRLEKEVRLLKAYTAGATLFCTMFVLGQGPVLAQDSIAVKRQLEVRYEELAAAHDRQDVKAIVSLRTADFHTIGPDGRVADARMMEQYSKQFLEMNQPPYNIRITILKLAISENELIAIADVLQEATRYRDLAGRRRKVDTSVEQRETWSKTPDGWKLKSVDNVHNQKRFVDGKRVDPAKPYNPEDPPYNPDDAKDLKQ